MLVLRLLKCLLQRDIRPGLLEPHQFAPTGYQQEGHSGSFAFSSLLPDEEIA